MPHIILPGRLTRQPTSWVTVNEGHELVKGPLNFFIPGLGDVGAGVAAAKGSVQSPTRRAFLTGQGSVVELGRARRAVVRPYSLFGALAFPYASQPNVVIACMPTGSGSSTGWRYEMTQTTTGGQYLNHTANGIANWPSSVATNAFDATFRNFLVTHAADGSYLTRYETTADFSEGPGGSDYGNAAADSTLKIDHGGSGQCLVGHLVLVPWIVGEAESKEWNKNPYQVLQRDPVRTYFFPAGAAFRPAWARNANTVIQRGH